MKKKSNADLRPRQVSAHMLVYPTNTRAHTCTNLIIYHTYTYTEKGEKMSGPGELAQWVKALATKPANPSSTQGHTQEKERIISHSCPDLCVHSMAHASPDK